LLTSYSQNVSIAGGSPNHYLKVDEVLANGVRITETLADQLSQFAPGDKILMIQMTGALNDTTIANFKTFSFRSRKTLQNTGKFEILQVDEINTAGVDTLVYFTDSLSNLYNNGEKIQLVRLVEGETVTVSGTVTPRAWDGEVGGIVAIIGIDTIKLQNNSVIDGSNRGFRGGSVPDEIYEDGKCRYGLSPVIKDTLYFRSAQLGRSGNKGEGVISRFWPYTKGTSFNINGGGAGNGLFSGGGGGSNLLAGGDGGQQSAYCTSSFSAQGGYGGFACSELYINPRKPKAIMGGGGGSGSRMSGSTPSRGGNGGGMVILITGTLVSGSATPSIRVNGENANPSTTTGSGAGGGGGGTILIDATNFAGPSFTVQIKGGSGSSTTAAAPNCNGAGGGGSGGVFWHSGSISPVISLDSLNGSGGITSGGSGYPDQVGLQGLQGMRLKDLIIPLTGFLFNSIRGTDTICEAQFPDRLTGSQPKGGNGIYDFEWQQSIDNVTWSAAIGDNDLRFLQPVALNQTTYYRRIVTSENPVTVASINDTSRVVKIFVYPAIANNSILGTDTVCYNIDGKPVTGIVTPLTGGDNIYSYQWQQSTDKTTWNSIGTQASFDPGALTMSTDFRRIVNSTAYCSDTSEFVAITVLPSITRNDFNIADTSICENTSPGRLNIKAPDEGDGTYTYQWQYMTTGSWNSIPSTSDSVMYTAGTLTETTAYRRIVYSGYNDACIDTSNARTVSIRPLISNNFIDGAPVKYTCFNSPAVLAGSDPENGFGPGTYSYGWEESNDNVIWQALTATTQDLQSNNLTTTRYFRRKVYSTPQYHECNDVSPSVEVRINPLPSGNVFSASDTLCAGATLYVKFNVAGNGPFNVSLEGQNETAKSLAGISGPSDSIAFNPQMTQEFMVVSVEDDSGCFADPAGFIPVTAGIVYEVPVANAGNDDEICDDSYILSAIKTDAAYKGLWTGSGCVFSDSVLENSEVTVDLFGTQVFKWTETNWNCTDDDEVEITFFEQPQVPDAGNDQDLSFKFTTQLQASEPSAGTGTWTILSGMCEFDNNTERNTVIRELDNNVILKWTIVNGVCPAVSDSLKIIVRPLEIKKAFTPNGDGKNDFFDLGAVDAENIEIKVFNRTGQLVFESDNYCAVESGMTCDKWTGINENNVELPEGAYFYIANIKIAGKSEKVQFRSFVEIMRK